MLAAGDFGASLEAGSLVVFGELHGGFDGVYRVGTLTPSEPLR